MSVEPRSWRAFFPLQGLSAPRSSPVSVMVSISRTILGLALHVGNGFLRKTSGLEDLNSGPTASVQISRSSRTGDWSGSLFHLHDAIPGCLCNAWKLPRGPWSVCVWIRSSRPDLLKPIWHFSLHLMPRNSRASCSALPYLTHKDTHTHTDTQPSQGKYQKYGDVASIGEISCGVYFRREYSRNKNKTKKKTRKKKDVCE